MCSRPVTPKSAYDSLQHRCSTATATQPPSSAASNGTGLELGNFGTAEFHHFHAKTTRQHLQHRLTLLPLPLNRSPLNSSPHFPPGIFFDCEWLSFEQSLFCRPSVEISITFQLTLLTESHHQPPPLLCHQPTPFFRAALCTHKRKPISVFCKRHRTWRLPGCRCTYRQYARSKDGLEPSIYSCLADLPHVPPLVRLPGKQTLP